MRTRTLTPKEYASLYGCIPRYVTRKLSENTMLTGMVSFRKSGGTWMIQVLESWIESKTEKV